MAEWCGIAFQLTNILADVDEDAREGRIYLPQEDLRRFGLTDADLAAGVEDERWRRLMRSRPSGRTPTMTVPCRCWSASTPCRGPASPPWSRSTTTG